MAEVFIDLTKDALPTLIGYKTDDTSTSSVDGTAITYENVEEYHNGDCAHHCRALTQDQWKRVDCSVHYKNQ